MDLLYCMMRPVRAVAKRWGPRWAKRLAWQAEYERGVHQHRIETPATYRSKICDRVERYARGGDILDLGCGDGCTSLGLKDNAFTSYLGVDISEAAVAEAVKKNGSIDRHPGQSVLFRTDDIAQPQSAGPFDVILFKDSLYYINRLKVVAVLRGHQATLKPAGVFIVQMNDVKRHGWIRELIRSTFQVLEDIEEPDSDNMILVFR